MAILETCCFLTSVRRASFVFGVFTLLFYTGTVAGGSFFIHESKSQVLLVTSVFVIVFSVTSLIASVFLILGLCVDSRHLLLPWIVSVTIATFLDVIFSTLVLIHKKTEPDSELDDNVEDVFVVGIVVVGFNMYGVLCVIAQYHLYAEGKGTADYNLKNPPTTIFNLISKKLSPSHVASETPNHVMNTSRSQDLESCFYLDIPKAKKAKKNVRSSQSCQDSSSLEDGLSSGRSSLTLAYDDVTSQPVSHEIDDHSDNELGSQ